MKTPDTTKKNELPLLQLLYFWHIFARKDVVAKNVMEMKKIMFILLSLVWQGIPLKAFDFPEASKDGKIKWYFLQSKRSMEGDVPFVWTATEDEVFGFPRADSSNYEVMDKQLWCFVPENDGLYAIYNRYYGRRLGVGKGLYGEAVMLVDEPQAAFTIKEIGFGLQLKSDRRAPGGNVLNLYASQTTASDCYIIKLVNESLSQSINCAFEVIEYHDSYAPQNKETATWYNIANAEDGGSVIADNTSVVDAQYKFTVEGKDKADPNAQWRLVETRPGRVSIVNRATKNSISTTLIPQDRYNLPAADDASSAPSWWSLLPAGGGQYAIAATGIDNIRRYLNLQILGDAPNALPESLLIAGTKFAWTFVEAGTENGIDNAAAQEDGSVRIEDGRISAPDGAEVTVFTPEGVRLSPSARLVPGVYIVTVNGRTSKISVH